MMGTWLIKLLNSLRHLIKFLHCDSSGVLAGRGGVHSSLRTLFRRWQSDFVTYSMKSIWTQLMHCLCFFSKNKYVKWCASFSAMTWNLFYSWCPRKNFRCKNIQIKGERKRIFNYCFINIQGRVRQNLFCELYFCNINNWLTLETWIIKPVGFVRQALSTWTYCSETIG